MRFRNAGISPPIMRLEAAAKVYLVRHGWRSLGSASSRILEMFEGPGEGKDTEAVLVPLKADRGPTLQGMIDLVSKLARVEDGWALAVPSEMLEPSGGAPVQGLSVGTPAKLTPREEVSVVRYLVDQSDWRRASTSPEPNGLSETTSFTREGSR